MFKKQTLFLTIFFFLFFQSYSFGNSQGYRDELPPLEKLSDLTVGVKRIQKGIKYEKKGKFKKANKMYNEAISFLLKSNRNKAINSDTYFYLGYAYDKINDIDNSLIYYNLGLVIDPKNLKINKFLGNLYLKINKPAKAKEILQNIEYCNCNEYNDLKLKIKNN